MKKEEYIKSDKYKSNISKLSENGIKKIKEIKKERIYEYELNPVSCLCCGNPIEYRNKSRNKFCSSSCSATYNNKIRIRKKMNSDFKEKMSKLLLLYNKNKINKRISVTRKCELCGSEFIVNILKCGVLSRKRFCSNECLKKSASEKLSLAIRERIKNGTHKGWQSRNVESYPETFFKKVLENNNIKYEFNKIISKRSLGIDCDSNYFLDFYITDKNIDLEIDGQQHKLKERVESDELRNSGLINSGFIIYRIEWKDINTKSGKKYIKNEIDKFLKFIE